MIGIKEEFGSLLRETLGDVEGAALVAALDTEAVTGVRLNARKAGEWPSEIDGEDVPWCAQGLVLHSRPQFTLMPEWHGGLFYVQEPASMVVGEIVRRLADRLGNGPIRYLDSCAAPGGKTTAVLSALPDDAFVVANEFVPARANILSENISKWGAANAAVCNGDTKVFRKLRRAFDIVAVDAPCSGEGMMRKDEEARRQWSEGLVAQCAALQREILDNVWEALKPGGFLIYSTCTFNRTEDEDMLRHIVEELGGESVDTGLADEFGIPGSLDPSLHALRFMPHRTRGEGLFLGVIRKPGEYKAEAWKPRLQKGHKGKGAAVPLQLTALLKEPEKMSFSQRPDECWQGVPAPHADLVRELEQATRLITAGARLGTVKGKSRVPDSTLALSTSLREDAFPRVEVTLETALNYLRRQAVALPAESPRGITLLTYRGAALGFVKNLGNRANNMYPQHWRIRHL